MNPSQDKNRKRRSTRVGVESLEDRKLMTGGAGDTFAIIPGAISTPGGTVSIPVTIDTTHFHIPHGSMTLGIDIVPATNSNVKPVISSVADSQGHVSRGTTHALYSMNAALSRGTPGQKTSAVLTPVSFNPHDPTKPVTYNVKVTAQSKTSGNFLIGFFLPGDANGDGTVNQGDIKTIKANLGTNSSQTKYNFDADVNRDGRINRTDLALARRNLGMSTTVSPIVTANLDPASDSGLQDRVTSLRSVHFSGTATPGATITYAETVSSATEITAASTGTGSNPASFTTTADSTGNYNLTVTLADGVDQFKVSTHDAFGQGISGTIAPVTFSASAPGSLIASITPVTTTKPTS